MDPEESGWTESTEGDLDFDLTEEAGYRAWDAPDRSLLIVLARVLFGLALVGMVLGTIVSLL